MLMIIKLNVLLIAACAHAAEVATASTFQPWALNDSKAFVFPRIAEKRNRGRRERLAAALRNEVLRERTVAGPARATCARAKPRIFSRRGGYSDRGRAPRIAPTQRRRGGQEESLESSEDCEFEASTRATRPANADTNNRALR